MLQAFRRAAYPLVASVLAGCVSGTPGSTSLPPAPTPALRDHAAVDGALLYVTDARTHHVVVLTYPGARNVATLTGFSNPQGECVDASGDVWIVDIGQSKITQYAHGGSTPIATLSDPGQFPTACSVNPKNGDLAVANAGTLNLGPGSISIYSAAHGTPTNYTGANLGFADSIAYDDSGNLFVAGTQQPSTGFYYGVIRDGAKALRQLHWPKAVAGAALVWDGHDIAVINAPLDSLGIPVYRLAGNRLVGTTYLAGTCNFFQFFIDRHKLLCSDKQNQVVRIYAYPNGGLSVGAISTSVHPNAAVVSR